MQFRSCCKKIIVAAMLVLGSVAPTFGAAATDGAAQAQYDFSVTATTKDKTHPHFGEGGLLGFVINGVQGRSLILVRGKTYLFGVDTGPMHDFYLATDPMGWGTAPLTAGVKGNFTYKGTLTFTPSAETPELIYYACRNHKFMGGEIHIVNPGEENKTPEPQAAASAVQTTRPALDKNEVQQRLNFVNMYITTSAAAGRIAASNNEEAKTKYKNAQDRLAEAVSAFDSDKLQEAKSKFDEAMSLMNEAAKLVPSESMLKLAKAKNEELMRGVADMEASYKQNRDSIVGEGGAKNLPKLDSEKLHKTIDTAKTLAEEGKYDEANKILSGAMNEISDALNKLLANRTVAYEMKFETPAQEYEYELDRFSSLEKSIPLAIEQKQPSQATLTLTESYVDKGKEKRAQANADAKQKNFAAATENIKNGSEQLETALKLLGVH
jgi:hypothetical protein